MGSVGMHRRQMCVTEELLRIGRVSVINYGNAKTDC